MEKSIEPTVIIIFGISGDLAKRKLLPAIEQIAAAGVLPKDFKVVGVTRQNLRKQDILPKQAAFLDKHVRLYKMDTTSPADYKKLGAYLREIDSSFASPAQRLFYLSIPPQISAPVVELLGASGLAKAARTKLLLEKPFGTDYASAAELIETLHTYFDERQLYRIDHYLAKEMAQNIVVFRSNNSLFRHTWNNSFIEAIDIVATEKIGIEGRSVFYEQTGALRDVLQSHLLQLAALILMDLPEPGSLQSIPKRRLALLQSLELAGPPLKSAKRAQYDTYREEVGNPRSTTETFVSITLSSKDERWKDVPITLTTGKALSEKATRVRIRYRQKTSEEANELVLRIQPNEGIELDLWAKIPGYERKLQKLSLAFAYDRHFEKLPDAYERVFVDAMRSDHALFTTSDEVLTSWKIIAPVQEAWEMSSDDPVFYKAGTSPDKLL